MGYYTSFELSVLSGDRTTDHEEKISEIIDFNPFEENCKWYEYDTDMKSYSQKYPNTVFELFGEGEESGDVWKAYYKDGKMFKTTATLVFEEFTEDKLK